MPVANIDEGSKFYSALLDHPGFRISGGRHYFQCGDVILAVYDASADGDAGGVRSNPQHVLLRGAGSAGGVRPRAAARGL